MASNFVKSVKSLIASDKTAKKEAGDAITSIADDLRSKAQEAEQQREKVKNAIDSGSRISKRRIPL